MNYRRRALVISCLVHGLLAVLLLAMVRQSPTAPDLLVIDFSIATASAPAVASKPSQPAEVAAPAPLLPPPEPPVELAAARPLKSKPEKLLPIAEPASEPEPAPVAPSSAPAISPQPVVPQPLAPPPPVIATGADDGADPAVVAPAAAGSTPPPAVDQYLEANFHYIMEDIQRGIVYPRLARRMGWEGKVVISFVVLEDGGVEDIRIVESSGFSMLDKNAVQTIKETAPFPSPPVRAILVVPVAYRLS